MSCSVHSKSKNPKQNPVPFVDKQNSSVLIFLPFCSLFSESFFGDSFCVLNAVQDVSNFQLSLQIKTSRRSGLLLLAAGMEDYLFLELLNGKVQVKAT